ncbi:MAG: hypothetical protein FJ303_09200 [Planctomycetes bacterium]|nr:hypothetical protein [Planctomycetota bacterium]
MPNDTSSSEPLYIRLARLLPSPLPLCLFLTLLVLGYQTCRKAEPALDAVVQSARDVLVTGWLRGMLEPKYLATGFNVCLIIVAGGALARAA